MALVNCPECNHQVSDSALKCTACGVQLRRPKRTAVGKIIKWVFILFNLLMILLMWGGCSNTSEVMSSAQSSAEQAGATIGAGLGLTFMLFIWALGDVILGLLVLFTRPKN